MGLAGAGASRLDDVRVDRTLREPVNVLEFSCFFFEYLDEPAADYFSLFFRIVYSR